MIICAYGALIKEPLLSDHEMYNVHPSLLPRWRGAAPIERAIEAGDEETGVTIMRPTAELDAGPMRLQQGEPIQAEDDFGSLSARLAVLGASCSWRRSTPSPSSANSPSGRHLRREDRAQTTACSIRSARPMSWSAAYGR